MVAGVLAEIEDVGELDALVDLLHAEALHVKVDALQVQEEHVGELLDALAATEGSLLAAAFLTLELRHGFTLAELFEGIVNGLLVLDLDCHEAVLVNILTLESTVLADTDRVYLRSDAVRDEVLEGRVRKLSLKLPVEPVYKLARVLLLTHIDALTLEVAVGEAQVGRVDCFAVGELKGAEERLKLVEHVIVHLIVLLSLFELLSHTILASHEAVAQRWDVVELLQDADHVADVAEVDDA